MYIHYLIKKVVEIHIYFKIQNKELLNAFIFQKDLQQKLAPPKKTDRIDQAL